MRDEIEGLAGLPVFSGYTGEEIRLVAGLCVEERHPAGTQVFSTGDPGGGMFIVLEGAVELTTVLPGNVEKTLSTIRPGYLFGAVSLIDDAERHLNARTIEPTRTLRLDRAAADTLLRDHPAVGLKLMRFLAALAAQMMRLSVEQYRRIISWSLEVSGATALNLHRLVSDGVELLLELVGGRSLRGRILNVEASAAGHELVLRLEDGQIAIVPYHAILLMALPPEALPAAGDLVPEV